MLKRGETRRKFTPPLNKKQIIIEPQPIQEYDIWDQLRELIEVCKTITLKEEFLHTKKEK